MQPCVKSDISFKSANNRSTINGVAYHCPDAPPFCVVQVSHGMCEYFARYEEFALYMAKQGVAVCGNDHLGHGKSAGTPDELGFFGRKGGRDDVLLDLKTMNDKIHQMFPGVPLVLLGHSMGSFFARRYVCEYPDTISGLIISGTGGPNPATGIAIKLADLFGRIKGPGYRSKLVHNLAFGTYLKKIDSPRTQYDWISRDETIVSAYAADPFCTFRFTVNGFRELFSALGDVSRPEWAAMVPKNKPVLMIQGDADPVGNYGKGTAVVRDRLLAAGLQNLEYKLYEGGRHEMLNETNRLDVYQDIMDFIVRWWGKKDNENPTN